MLKQLHLENFKAFRHLDLPLRPLTLLTGVNSMGKSSVLQALLLLRQSYQRQPYPDEALNLHLNAHLVQVGTADDVFYKLMTTPSLSLGLALDEAPQTALWRYAFRTPQENILKAQASPPPPVYEQALFSDNFHYLQADRFGPQVFYATDDDHYHAQQFYVFQPDNTGSYHGYPLTVQELGPKRKAILEALRAKNLLSPAEYQAFIH